LNALNVARSPQLVAWGVLLASLSLTAVAWYGTSRAQHQRENDRFEHLADELVERVKTRMSQCEQVLRAGATLADTHEGRPTRAQWHRLYEDLRIPLL
jgi:CHASE1-domain containing sensor protein